MLKENQVPKFDGDVYKKVALNELVTYAVFYLGQRHERISAENITAAAFFLFPERFAMRGFPQWPDSTVVNKRWIDCRNKGFIAGSTATDFALTPRGFKIAERVGEILTGKRSVFNRQQGSPKAELRTRAGRFVRVIGEFGGMLERAFTDPSPQQNPQTA